MNGKKFQRNNATIAIMCYMSKKLRIYSAYFSKFISNHENQIIPFMIPKEEGCHYLVVEKLSALLRGISSKLDGNFYFSNCLQWSRTNKKLEYYNKVSEYKSFCGALMVS